MNTRKRVQITRVSSAV